MQDSISTSSSMARDGGHGRGQFATREKKLVRAACWSLIHMRGHCLNSTITSAASSSHRVQAPSVLWMQWVSNYGVCNRLRVCRIKQDLGGHFVVI